jgi:hypothetical protein
METDDERIEALQKKKVATAAAHASLSIRDATKGMRERATAAVQGERTLHHRVLVFINAHTCTRAIDTVRV